MNCPKCNRRMEKGCVEVLGEKRLMMYFCAKCKYIKHTVESYPL